MSVRTESNRTALSAHADTALEEASASVQQGRSLLADAVASLHASFRETQREARHQQAMLEETLSGASDSAMSAAGDAIRTTTDALSAIEDRIRRLGERADAIAAEVQRIFRLLQQIDDVAESTSVLAINAALEAVRAGDQGKGFKLVADEIRSLSRATKDLSARVEDGMTGAREEVGRLAGELQATLAQDLPAAGKAQQTAHEALAKVDEARKTNHSNREAARQSSCAIQSATAQAIQGLHFDDMVGQIFDFVGGQIDAVRSGSVDREDRTVKASQVSQTKMSEGDIEFF